MNKIIDDKREGYWELYWTNGKLWEKGNYVNDLRHGKWVYIN